MRKVSKDYFKVFDMDFNKDNLTIKEFLNLKGIDKLYHVSKVPYKLNKIIPQIPENRLPNENDTEKRICLSTSIENSINAIDFIGFIESLQYTNVLNQETLNSYFNDNYFIDSLDITNIVFSVYEIDINDLDLDKLITYPELFINNDVQDAIVFNEFWYKDKIIKYKHKTVRLTNYQGNISADDYILLNGYNLLKTAKNINELEKQYEYLVNDPESNMEYYKVNGQEIAKDLKFTDYKSISKQEYQNYISDTKNITSGFYLLNI